MQSIASGAPTFLYAVLDPAQDARIYPTMRTWAPEAVCLFEKDRIDPRVERVAPHILPFVPGSLLASWWRDAGLGRHWGIFCRTAADLSTLRHHFRTLLRVQLPDSRITLFRFYDPRVLRVFLRVCDPVILRRVFGPVDFFLVENEAGSAFQRFEMRDGHLDVT